jgi:hypothetical protein
MLLLDQRDEQRVMASRQGYVVEVVWRDERFHEWRQLQLAARHCVRACWRQNSDSVGG